MGFIAHVDLDAFFASVEELDHPEYIGFPLVVGADPKEGRGRGVATTANYAAREFGIRSAMPISEAWRRCPTARFVKPRFHRYQEKSEEVFDLLRESVDLVEQASIDEAYLDLSQRGTDFPAALAFVKALQKRIHAKTRLTASFGLSASKTLSKIASDINKPNGITAVPPGTEAAFLAPLPARKIPGVGPKTDERLAELGIHTCGDLAALSRERLLDLFGSWGPRLGELARGVDAEPVRSQWTRKSAGNERTYFQDVEDPRVWEATLRDLSEDGARTLVEEGVGARTVTLKVRMTGFETYTRARTLPAPVQDAEAILRIAKDLLRESPPSRAVRLLGVRLTGLTPGVAGQASLRAWPADIMGEHEAWHSPQRRVDEYAED